jgi:hypothetical protein
VIYQHGKPMSFEDVRAQVRRDVGVEPGTELRLSFERSLRRALHRLCEDEILIAIGDGGRGDPFRYFIHPLIIGLMGDTPEAHALEEALEADAGAKAAMAKENAKMEQLFFAIRREVGNLRHAAPESATQPETV